VRTTGGGEELSTGQVADAAHVVRTGTSGRVWNQAAMRVQLCELGGELEHRGGQADAERSDGALPACLDMLGGGCRVRTGGEGGDTPRRPRR
jgi:hypothetical protein